MASQISKNYLFVHQEFIELLSFAIAMITCVIVLPALIAIVNASSDKSRHVVANWRGSYFD